MKVNKKTLVRSLWVIPMFAFILLPLYFAAYIAQEIADFFGSVERKVSKKLTGMNEWWL